MIRNALQAIANRLPFRIISDNGEPYLVRYYVGTLFGWRFYLHHFVGSDPARGLHDHPWRKAYSLVLAGWYFEETRSGTRKVRWFNRLTGDTFHRVVLPDDPEWLDGFNPQPCWTMFAHSVGDVKPWGFLREPKAQIGNGRPFSLDDGVLVFVPYQYDKEGGKPKDWWKTAPTRRQLAKGFE